MPLEQIQKPLPSLKTIIKAISFLHISNAVIAFLFAASAPIAIVLGVGIKGGLTESDLASWIFGAFSIFNVPPNDFYMDSRLISFGFPNFCGFQGI